MDPSEGMVSQARSLSPSLEYPNVAFMQASAEKLVGVEDESVDLVVAGQAAHWFDQDRLWPEMRRILRQGATLAFWGYKDHVFVDYPKATEILNSYAYGESDKTLGPYWSLPARSIVQRKYRDIQPPEPWFSDVQRIEYEPGTAGSHTGEGTMFLERRLKVTECMEYIRTWSAYHGWREAHPEKQAKSKGETGT